jgi:hypothetical protein
VSPPQARSSLSSFRPSLCPPKHEFRFLTQLCGSQPRRRRAMSPEPPVAIVTDGTLNVPHDPPPPYPSRDRRQRRRRPTVEISSADSDDFTFPSPAAHTPPLHHHPDETTPLLGVSTTPARRPRTMSLSSAASMSPSLAQTVVSAFRMDLDSDAEDTDEPSHGPPAVGTLPNDHLPHATGVTRRQPRGCRARLGHYFRPIGRRAYWSALLHLLVYNFPYALLAWVYLFVFTLVSDSLLGFSYGVEQTYDSLLFFNCTFAVPQLGTILLVALPLGAVLCFFDLLGARALARGEVRIMLLFLSGFPKSRLNASCRPATCRWPCRALSMALLRIHLRAIDTPYSLVFGRQHPKKSRRGWDLGTSGRSIATRSPW